MSLPLSNRYTTRASGVAQVLEHLLSNMRPCVQTPVLPKKKKKKEKKKKVTQMHTPALKSLCIGWE
jgi:hypothetical protein